LDPKELRVYKVQGLKVLKACRVSKGRRVRRELRVYKVQALKVLKACRGQALKAYRVIKEQDLKVLRGCRVLVVAPDLKVLRD
jgi:hypothetical protein